MNENLRAYRRSAVLRLDERALAAIPTSVIGPVTGMQVFADVDTAVDEKRVARNLRVDASLCGCRHR
jgi:hypothetical protein